MAVVYEASIWSLPKIIGCVTLSTVASGRERKHWEDVFTTPGRPVAQWHALVHKNHHKHTRRHSSLVSESDVDEVRDGRRQRRKEKR